MPVTLTQGLRLAPPAEKLDQLRYNARLEKAGVPQEVIDARHISPEVADQFVKGGFRSLLGASRTTGRAGVLELGDLKAVEVRQSPMAAVFGFVGVKPADRADKRATEATEAARALAASLREGARGGAVAPLELFAQLNDVTASLESALQPGHLAEMSQTASDALSESLSTLHAATDGCHISIKGAARVVSFDGRLSNGIENLQHNLRRLPELLAEVLDRPPPDFRIDV